jgi:3-deoxy-D-manno-octulosonic-acid transferase
MANVKAVAEEFKAKGAAFEVADGHALCAALANLLADEEKRIAMGRQALSASVNEDVAVRNNYALAARYLSDSRGATAHV